MPLRPEIRGTMAMEDAIKVVDLWIEEGLKNVRFSGGEPTIYPGLKELVARCKAGNIQHIAISTNGSAKLEYYKELIEAGVNDISISLDGACCSVGDKMSGGIKGSWEKVTANIRALSQLTYVTVGMVFTEDNVSTCVESVLFADSLGVSDIRVVPSKQYDQALILLSELPQEVLDKYPILKYRVNNIKAGQHVRGMKDTDADGCWLALDDMAIAGKYHYPCIIYMRVGGDPIGEVGPHMREERAQWIQNHNPKEDPICRSTCLDVCVFYNNVAARTHCKCACNCDKEESA
jgi:hypothetical protein